MLTRLWTFVVLAAVTASAHAQLRLPSLTAPGADIKTVNLEGMVDVCGTSFAAPVVAARLAELPSAPDRSAAVDAIDSLARRASDLGPSGKDLTYGYGFIVLDTP